MVQILRNEFCISTKNISIKEGVLLPSDSRELFSYHYGTLDIYENIDVSNIMDATEMFAGSNMSAINTDLWNLNPKCVVTGMLRGTEGYTGRDLEKEQEIYAPKFKILNKYEFKNICTVYCILTVQELNSDTIFKTTINKSLLQDKSSLRKELIQEFNRAVQRVIRNKEKIDVDIENDII